MEGLQPLKEEKDTERSRVDPFPLEGLCSPVTQTLDQSKEQHLPGVRRDVTARELTEELEAE